MKREPIPSSTGSETGSHHWFMTLLARHKHMGEFLKDKTPDGDVLKKWSEDLYATSEELITWFHNANIEKLATDKSKQIARIKHLYDNPPYKEMLTSQVVGTKQAAENASLGWVGALSTVLVILEGEK